MFGLSFPELVVLLLVAVVVLGPKELPRYLRKAGQLAGQLRRMAYDMRAKSGIDEILRNEGVGADIAEIRRLASFARSELGSIATAVRSAAEGAAVKEFANPYARTSVAGAPAAPAPAALPPAGAVPAGAAVPAAVPVPALRDPAAVPYANGSHGFFRADRAREYPSGGPDTYGALPEGASVYNGDLAPSPLAADPLYARGVATEDAPEAAP